MRGRRTNEEEWRPVSEDGGRFKVARVQVNKNPYAEEALVFRETNRGILVDVVEVRELGDAAFVEKDYEERGDLQYRGELEDETADEEVKYKNRFS